MRAISTHRLRSHGSFPLTPTCLEQPHELAYSIEHELHSERRKQNAEHTCDDVQATRAKQAHQSLSAGLWPKIETGADSKLRLGFW
jgi:hypothetical protein